MHPMHPWCCSSTEPVLSSDTRALEKRWARDPVTGEEMKVPADMTYREWEKKMAEMNGNRAGKQSSVEQKISHKALNNQTDNGKMNVGGCKDYGELKHYLDTQHGIQLDSPMKNLHLSSVKSAFEGIEHAINDVPELANIIKGASASQNTDFMACTYNGFLHFNESLYKNPQTLKKVFKENIALGYWIKGSSLASVGVHEASHLVERMLIDKSGKYQSHFEKIEAWNKCTEAKKIVSKACTNVKKTSFGKGKTKKQLLGTISAYAKKDASEALADSFRTFIFMGKTRALLLWKSRDWLLNKFHYMRGRKSESERKRKRNQAFLV